MFILVIVIEISTLLVVRNIYKNELKDFALTELKTLNKSINNDLLKAILNPTIDSFTDISYRLSAFKPLQGLVVFDNNNNPIFKYKEIGNLVNIPLDKNYIFTKDSLIEKENISADGYTYGYSITSYSLKDYREKQEKNLIIIMSILPFALLLGFFISLILSKSYTKPFSELLKAMKNSDPTQDKIEYLKTDTKNEIQELYSGFNKLMTHINNSTKRLKFQAEHDLLTNLYNRFYITQKIKKALGDESRTSYVLVSIDLDQFSIVNSTVGYQNGDELLKMIALKLDEQCPSDAVLARVDGDNFMILLKNFSKEQGIEYVETKLDFLKDFRFSAESQSFSITASVGLVCFKPFEFTPKELSKHIDTAVFLAKDYGRNRLHIFNAQDDNSKKVSKEVQTARQIKEALKDGPSKFELYAQAIVPLQYTTDKISYEILIRMWDEDSNFISPMDFLPTADKYQLMAKIDMHVLWSYLETVVKTPLHVEKLHTVHINLAGSTLNNADFQAKIKKAVEFFDFPWHKLELEVTETSAIGNFNQAKDFISWLKSKNIGLALDDFGTGMSSFEYLKSLPFDIVKIDGSFVKDMHTDPTDRAVIKYIQEIASLKSQETVAEYVETKEDVVELTKIGITYGQGYFLGKPKSLTDWL